MTFSPETAEAAGKQKVTISFKDTGKYKGYDPIETTVNVIDPEDVDVSLDTDKHIDINLECNDLLQKYSIQFIKTDKKGEMLPGAKFALKAACEKRRSFTKEIRSQPRFPEMISSVIWNSLDCQLAFMQKTVLEKKCTP